MAFVSVAEIGRDLSGQYVVRADIGGGELLTLRFPKLPVEIAVRTEANRVLAAREAAARSELRQEYAAIDGTIEALRARKDVLSVQLESVRDGATYSQ
jgi:hypothetical protein